MLAGTLGNSKGISLPLLHCHHRLTISHCHAIGICVVLILLLLLEVLTKTLSLRDRAIFVLQKDLLQLDNFVPKLVDLGG